MEGDILIVDWKKNQPKNVVWAFNEHARERITGELALEMIQSLKKVKPGVRITIVPVVNVWGRKRVDNGMLFHCVQSTYTSLLLLEPL